MRLGPVIVALLFAPVLAGCIAQEQAACPANACPPHIGDTVATDTVPRTIQGERCLWLEAAVRVPYGDVSIQPPPGYVRHRAVAKTMAEVWYLTLHCASLTVGGARHDGAAMFWSLLQVVPEDDVEAPPTPFLFAWHARAPIAQSFGAASWPLPTPAVLTHKETVQGPLVRHDWGLGHEDGTLELTSWQRDGAGGQQLDAHRQLLIGDRGCTVEHRYTSDPETTTGHTPALLRSGSRPPGIDRDLGLHVSEADLHSAAEFRLEPTPDCPPILEIPK